MSNSDESNMAMFGCSLEGVRALFASEDDPLMRCMSLLSDAQANLPRDPEHARKLINIAKYGIQQVRDGVLAVPAPRARNMVNPLFGYYIDLDERGEFEADVRDENGQTIFEIKAGASLGEDESSVFDDGFMRHKDDLVGLSAHLKDLKLIPGNAELLGMQEFEQRTKQRALEKEVEVSGKAANHPNAPARAPGM